MESVRPNTPASQQSPRENKSVKKARQLPALFRSCLNTSKVSQKFEKLKDRINEMPSELSKKSTMENLFLKHSFKRG